MKLFWKDKKRKPEAATSGFNVELPQTSGSPDTILFSYYILRLFASMEAYLFLHLIEIQCRWCELTFCICRSCWKGQAYCCDICRLFGKLKIHREAQRRYRKTEKGKKAHREAENRRRHGLSKKNQKNMDDASSTVLPAWGMKLLLSAWNRIFHGKKTLHCHFCGRFGAIVDEFPRRGYG